jgi:hypothetical protein
MIAATFKKHGKEKFLAVVKPHNSFYDIAEFIGENSDALKTLIAEIKDNAFSISPDQINKVLHGNLSSKPASLIAYEAKTLVGTRMHIDYALECTITDLEFLAEKDLESASKVAEMIFDVFADKSGEPTESAQIEGLSNFLLAKLHGHLKSQATVMASTSAQGKVTVAIDLMNQIRRTQSRLVDAKPLAHLSRILDAEILSLDILGPTLRFGITDSLSRFYLDHINSSLMIIGITNDSGRTYLVNTSDAQCFYFLNNIDHNTNKAVITRLHEKATQELCNLFTYGPMVAEIYNVTDLKKSIKELKSYNADDVEALISGYALNVVDRFDYLYSNNEYFDIFLRKHLKENQENLC